MRKRWAYLFNCNYFGDASAIFKKYGVTDVNCRTEVLVSCRDQILVSFARLVNMNVQSLIRDQLDGLLFFCLACFELHADRVEHQRASLAGPLLQSGTQHVN